MKYSFKDNSGLVANLEEGMIRAVVPPNELLILGAGTYALEVAEMAQEAGHRVIGFAVNVEPRPGSEGGVLWGKPVWWLEDVGQFCQVAYAIAAIVSPERKGIINLAGERGFTFAQIIHKSAAIPPSARVGSGAIISRQVAVGYGASIGHHVIVNRGATIGHHCKLRAFSTIGPGANLAGCVEVGRGVTIGMGANILEDRKIGEGAIVGAGAVVTRDVAPGAKVMGVPAREVA